MRYASLNVLGMIGLSCYILADTFFIARGLGSDGLAALNIAIPVYSFVHGCGSNIWEWEEPQNTLFSGGRKWNRRATGSLRIPRIWFRSLP